MKMHYINGITTSYEERISTARSLLGNAWSILGDSPYYHQVRFGYDLAVAALALFQSVLDGPGQDEAREVIDHAMRCLDDVRNRDVSITCYEGQED